MCLGVPGKIVEREPPGPGLAFAKVAFGGATRAVCIDLVPEAKVGDYVLVHTGMALQTIDADHAAELLEQLQASGDAEWQQMADDRAVG